MSMDNTESSEDDEYLLNQVLNNLYDFGDGVASETKQKKKKRKRRLESKEEEEEVISQDVCKETEHSHPEHLALNHSQKAPVKEPPRIQKPHVEVVTFEDPRKKIKVQKKPTPELKMEPKVKEKEDGNKDDPEEMTFEKARLDVHRFGIRGYKKEQQRSFEQERAIMLGAKAPKKQYVNYKTLQQDLQEKKKKAREEVQPEQKKKKGSKQGDKMQQKKKKKAGSGAAPSVFGSSAGSASMGRFKGGMLMLSSKEIQKINGPG